ncbi:MAG: hypothetical protein AB1831_11785 [Pseudomonadota bacterium]
MSRPPGRHRRARIADLAARLMVEHGIRDYALAKRKAARQLDLPEGFALPSNEEVDQALIERQNLYEPVEQTVMLRALREEALEVMQVFERFQPVLTGAVASGAVSEHCPVELDIQADSSKDFEQLLVNQDIEFKVMDRGGQMAYLIYAEPADVIVRMAGREARHTQNGYRPQLSLKQLRKIMDNAA